MIELQYGRDYYAKHGEMIAWCEENIGHGGFYLPHDAPDIKWRATTVFGHTSFIFYNDADAVMFIFKWGLPNR